jgi:hypothetical protein
MVIGTEIVCPHLTCTGKNKAADSCEILYQIPNYTMAHYMTSETMHPPPRKFKRASVTYFHLRFLTPSTSYSSSRFLKPSEMMRHHRCFAKLNCFKLFFLWCSSPNRGQGRLNIKVYRSHTINAHVVGLL